MKKISLMFSSSLIVLTIGSCQKKELLKSIINNGANSTSNQKVAPPISTVILPSLFTLGTLTTNGIVAKTSLIATNGNLAGNKILVDNMPEKVKSEGWIFTPPQVNAVKQAVNGDVDYYTFHYNTITQNGVGKNAYYVLLASNPNTFPVSCSAKGSILSKTDAGGFSFTNPSYFIEKESYEVSKRFIENNHTVNTGTLTLPALGTLGGNYKVLTYKAVAYNDGLDGRFLLNFSGNAYVYAIMVVKKSTETTAQMLARAVNLATSDNFTQANVAKRADGEWQDGYGWIAESGARYGRESGLYAKSAWQMNSYLTLPNSAGYIGMCLITDTKYTPATYPEDQTAPSVSLAPTDTRRYSGLGTLTNSTRTWGNFGHYYDITLEVENTVNITRNLKVSMAFNTPDPTKPNARFVGYAKVKDGSAAETGVDIKIRLNNPKANLLTFTCAPNSTKEVKVRFYVPGLITAGHQLIVETLN